MGVNIGGGLSLAAAAVALATATLEPAAALTASAPFTLKQTWNNAVVTFVGQLIDITKTAAAAGSKPFQIKVDTAEKFSVDTTGIVLSAAGRFGIVSDSAYRYELNPSANALYAVAVNTYGTAFTNDGVYVINTGYLAFGSSNVAAAGPDTYLRRDAANVIGMRNGATPQTFNVYKTWTDASNYEAIRLAYSGGKFVISGEKAGTGTNIDLGVTTTNNLLLGGVGVFYWTIDAAAAGGSLTAVTDNAYDIGKLAANRPRSGYFATSLFVGNQATNLNATVRFDANSSAIGYVGRISTQFGLFDGSGGIVLVAGGQGASGTWNSLLQIGGTSSSFPAVKRSATELQVRLADDSGPAPLRFSFLTKAGAFTNADILTGECAVGYDSSGGTRKLYANQGGTLYSVALA